MRKPGATLTVLVTGPDLADDRGAGIQRHVRTLRDGFADDAGIRVVPYASTSCVRDEPWLLKGTRLAWKYVTFPFAVGGCDVVHVNSTIDDRSVGRDSGFLAIASVLGRPCVLQFHGGGLHRLAHTRRGPLGAFVRWALKRPRVVLFLSHEQGEPMAEAFELNGVRYVRNYVDVESAPAHVGSAPGELHALYFGRLEPVKGVLEAIAGFEEASKRGWTLRVAGSGSIEAEVETLATGSPGVEYLGFLDDEARDRQLAWADVMLLPSAHDEGLPYAVLEAAAASAALVTSDRGALPSIVVDGVTGIVVPPRDPKAVAQALSRLADDRDLLTGMGAAARDLTRREFSLPRMRTGFTDVYLTAAGAREGAARGDD